MSTKGNATGTNVIRGAIGTPKFARGASAYEVAVINGFEGTEEEWLNSMKFPSEAQVASAVAKYMEENQTSSATIGEVTLLASKWEGTASLYSQEVQINGVTENSQVDLTPSIEQLAIFHNKDLAFVTENVDGVVTVYALGDKPTNDYTIQVTITEVYV